MIEYLLHLNEEKIKEEKLSVKDEVEQNKNKRKRKDMEDYSFEY